MTNRPWIVAAMAILFAALPWGGGQARAADRPGGRQAPGRDLAVGEMAPDFEIPFLSSATNLQAAAGAKPETVRLSSHRGKRPVVLILSSYT